MFTALIIGSLFLLAAALLGITGGTGAESYIAQDALLTLTLAGPAAASTTVKSTGLDTGETTRLATQAGNWEFLLTAPAMSAAVLPNGTTMTYAIIAADDVNLSVNPTTLATIITQTGAGGTGAPATSARYRLPTVSQRYVGFAMTSGAGTTTAAGVSATLAAVF
jgi:hypothetical protein